MTHNPYATKQHREMAEQYLRQQIEQASPMQQVLMLHDGVVKFVQQAKEAIGRNDIQARHNANRRAMEIVSHLIDRIDPGQDDDAAKRLHRIYTGLLAKLVNVDFKNDATLCDEVLADFKTLRTRFAQTAAGAAPAPTKPAGPAVAALEPEKHVQPGSHRDAVA